MSLPIDTYTRVLLALDHIGQGKTESHACDLAAVSVQTFRKCLGDTPELADLMVECEARGYDRMADALLHIDTDLTYGSSDPKKMKIVSDNIKWYLARKRPQQYGERVIVENTFTADRIITDALEQGKLRAMRGRVLEDVSYSVAQAVFLPPPPVNEKPANVISVDELSDDLLQFV